MQRSHEIDYTITGDDLQFVEVELDPGETVIGEAGTMMYIEDGITFETKMGDGAEPDQGMWGKLKSAGKRAITGESIFITTGNPRVSAATSASDALSACMAGMQGIRNAASTVFFPS